MLGDKLFTWSIFIFAGIWILGWVVLSAGLLIKNIFPKYEVEVENFFNKYGDIFSKIQKYILIFAITLFAIRLISGLLGWAPPLHGDID